MRIQHNIPAMSAYRNYTNNVSAVNKNLEKLSSGYRINRAGDDAAGLAISEKMRIQISGLEQAQSNAKAGINLVQTAEGALTEVHDMLNRMYTLAEQSANGTYADEVDREQLQKEVNSLRTEINRIADATNYNGINLLDGSLDSSVKTADEQDVTKIGTGDDAAFKIINDGKLGKEPQAGVFELDFTNFEGTVTDGTKETSITVFGKKVTIAAANTLATGAKITGEMVAEAVAKHFTGADADHGAFNGTNQYGVKLTGEQNGAKATLSMDKAPTAVWNEASDIVDTLANVTTTNDGGYGNQAEGLEVRTLVEPVDSTSSRYYAQASIDLTKLTGLKDGSTLTIGDSTYVFAVGSDSKYKNSENVIDLTDLSKDTDFTAKKNANKVAARITTAAKDNKNFKVTSDGSFDSAGDGKIYLTELEGGVDTKNYKLEGTATKKDGDWTGLLKFGSVDSKKMGKGLSLQIGDTAEDFNKMVVAVKDMHADAMGIGDIDISTQEGASEAMAKIKGATNYVSDVRGDLGALQNRLDHTIKNLAVTQENIQDAESTIRDVDIAKEMMAYTKNNILVQSAQAMLAQANQLPQGVLQLLG